MYRPGDIPIEEPNKTLVIKNPIVMLFDASYNDTRGLESAMNIIFEIVSQSKDTSFVYGMNERLNWHVENFAKQFRVPQELLVKFEYDRKSIQQARETFAKLISYRPNVAYIFRDNPKSGDSEAFVNDCINAKIKVIEINCNHEMQTLTKLNKTRTSKFYKEEFR